MHEHTGSIRYGRSWLARKPWSKREPSPRRLEIFNKAAISKPASDCGISLPRNQDAQFRRRPVEPHLQLDRQMLEPNSTYAQSTVRFGSSPEHSARPDRVLTERDRAAYLKTMPRKPLELPPAVARAFVRDVTRHTRPPAGVAAPE